MRIRHAILAAFLLVAMAPLSQLSSAPPTIQVPEKVYGEVGDWVFVKVTTDGKGVKIVAPEGLKQFPSDKLKDPNEVGFFSAKSGTYKVLLYTGNAEGPSDPKYLTVVFGQPPPIPPGPGPGPTPPDPPIPAPKGFRVIFVYESSEAMTPAQQQVMFGEKVRTYLDSKTVAGAGGKGWRRFDKDVDVKNEKDADIKALWTEARPKVTKVPCVIIAVDGKAEIIDFPASEDDALATLKKYGG